MQFEKYIEDINKRYATGIAREHTYRPSLQSLLEDVIPGIMASNDPARIECGAPDFILSRRKINVGYIEVKDIGDDLTKTEKSEQLKRYRDSLDNLILTDYLEFRFFIYGNKVETIRIGEIQGKNIKPLPENFDRLNALLIDFAAFQGQTIKSAKKLAVMMAHKARLMRDVFFKAVQDESENNTLYEQLQAFRTILVHDMDAAQFADVYAQTITYGLFTARLHDESLNDFSRAESFTLIPKSNPFLRQLFHYVAGPDLDDRVAWIVDALCEVYRATDLREILKDFGTATGQNDPILHFYETFLAEYDPKLRKSRGVFYTPEPVVNFIVRAIDDVLKTHFGLSEGLANTSTVEILVDTDTVKGGKRQKELKTVHKVQLLDVATGTGTFLAEAVKQIYSRFKGQEGLWSRYVENNLLPRLHGFELLMASYAICHMKLDLLLQETGYKPSDPNNPPRVSVYLTNSLEEYHPDMGTFFAGWLSREANEASRIKKDMPIMVAFGNPPYSVSSSNKGDWIQTLMEDYKRGLNEHNINSLSDDYVKFIRMSENYIEKNGYGIVAMITNNSFIDGIVHREMRKHLLSTFDLIYIYDLHGSSKKMERAPDGSKDDNVFDIMQGVSISIMIKDGCQKGKSAEVRHFDSYGRRQKKYDLLLNQSLKNTAFKKIECRQPYYFFVPKNFDSQIEYEKGFALENLFIEKGLGTKFRKDNLLVKSHHSKDDVREMIQDILSLPNHEILKKYNFKETNDWKLEEQKEYFSEADDSNIHKVLYRTFDYRYTYYPLKYISKIIPRGDSRKGLMQHLLHGKNYALLFLRNSRVGSTDNYLVSDCIVNKDAVSSLDNCHCAPLYLYQSILGTNEIKTPNFDSKIYTKIKAIILNVTPENLFDYIYAVLYSPAYRERYAEFLKSDFPCIPYPKDERTFYALSEKGAALRELHLMESPVLDTLITTYPIDGNHEVTKPRFEKEGKTGAGKVWINETQYFGNVPEIAWNFYIGGYQPAQKWLKDRKGRHLTIEDIRHWQRIIVALVETDRIMKEIDKIDFLPK